MVGTVQSTGSYFGASQKRKEGSDASDSRGIYQLSFFYFRKKIFDFFLQNVRNFGERTEEVLYLVCLFGEYNTSPPPSCKLLPRGGRAGCVDAADWRTVHGVRAFGVNRGGIGGGSSSHTLHSSAAKSCAIARKMAHLAPPLAHFESALAHCAESQKYFFYFEHCQILQHKNVKFAIFQKYFWRLIFVPPFKRPKMQ